MKKLFFGCWLQLFALLMYAFSYKTIGVIFPFLFFSLIVALITTVNRLNASMEPWFSFSCLSFLSSLVNLISLVFLGAAQTTLDVFTLKSFLNLDGYTTSITSNVNSPLAIYVWQILTNLNRYFNISFNFSIIVQLNTFLIALTMFVFERYVYSNYLEYRRFFKIAFLSGLLVFFSSLALRDSFIFFINSCLFVLFFSYFHRKISLFRFLPTALGLAIISSGFRYELLYFNSFLIFLVIMMKNLFDTPNSLKRILYFQFFLIVVSCLAFLYMDQVFNLLSRNSMSYGELAAETSGSGSLGMALIMSQPLPIKALLGSFALLINPIPLWRGFFDGSEYLFLKSWFGIFISGTLPVFIFGFIHNVKNFRSNAFELTIYLVFIVTLLATAVTSMEFRHLAVYFFIYMYLVGKYMKITTRPYFVFCYSGVAAIHFLWLILKL